MADYEEIHQFLGVASLCAVISHNFSRFFQAKIEFGGKENKLIRSACYNMERSY